MTANSGWKEAETKQRKRKEKMYVRGLADEFQRSLETEVRCWQCNKPGHLSSACPRGERCFVCNSPDHKRIECPTKRRRRWRRRGRALMSVKKEGKATVDWRTKQRDSGRELPELQTQKYKHEGVDNGKVVTSIKNNEDVLTTGRNEEQRPVTVMRE